MPGYIISCNWVLLYIYVLVVNFVKIISFCGVVYMNFKLFPLNIGNSHILERILCVRPARPDGIRIEAEQIDAKYIIHCYGHGGSGWTLAPGTTLEAINDILLKKLQGEWSNIQGKDVTIIGGGIIGQFSAYYLSKLKENYPNLIGEIKIVADKCDNITSDHAGGLFEPVLIGHSGTEKQLFNSFETYHNIGLGKSSDFQGVDSELMPSFSYAPSVSSQQLIDAGFIPPIFPTKLAIGNKTHDVFLTQLFFINVHHIRRELTKYINQHDIKIVSDVFVKEFSDVENSLIINCTGLGAKNLAHDNGVVPYLGHLITFKNQDNGLLDIDNCLFIDPLQKEQLLANITATIQSISAHKSIFGEIADNLISACQSIANNIKDNKPENDPNWLGVQRVQIFTNHSNRLNFIYSISSLLLAAKQNNLSTVYNTAQSTYKSSIGVNLKRYMFGLVSDDYPDESGKPYHGDAYAFPLLFGELSRESSGSFRYIDDKLAQENPVYVAGGTYILGENLPDEENKIQFARILDRLRYLGFN